MPTQGVSKLITVRNDYVHPKTSNYEDEMSLETRKLKRTPKRYAQINLPKDPFMWKPNDATDVLRLIDEFFGHVFVEKLNWDPYQVAFAVQSQMDFEGGSEIIFRNENLDVFLDTREAGNLKLDYMFFPEEGGKDIYTEYTE